ncbi:LamG-like jellyroll fold domain-containing protein [Gilvimarinus polysaccharolyticus]|uniref:LamG-like jellyroll fold domain-containing protein n=1 Tax=Gilvimarinus polysaccharolyticus TaxID=863921 RepID=UPI000673ACBD|nr:LamG-like jellyroll fold domain-containing protein [Gilvimarinus polysaccharolyticus]
MSDSNVDNTLERIAAKIAQGEASAEDHRTIKLLLKRYPDLSDQFSSTLRRYALIETQLVSEKQKRTFRLSILNRLSSKKRTNNTRRYWLSWGSTLAALLLLAVFISDDLGTDSSPLLVDRGVAIVSRVALNSSSQPWQTGESIQPGRYELTTGFVELEFYQGAKLTLQGPARFDIFDAQNVTLHQGKAKTDVPEVAIGFTVNTPSSRVIDLGTSVGIHVNAQGDANIQVFEGEVEMVGNNGSSQKFVKNTAGQSTTLKGEVTRKQTSNAATFKEFDKLDTLIQKADEERHRRWEKDRDFWINDPSLLAYYDFQPTADNSRVLPNIAKTQSSDGAVVGARWVDGPWPGKHALSFKRPGDRVRIDIPEKLQSFSLVTWVTIDSLDRMFSALLLTDGYKPSDIHWQLGQLSLDHGAIIVGLKSLSGDEKDYNYQPFLSKRDSGRWFHLAVSLDQKTQTLRFYVNGTKLSEQNLKHSSSYWSIGKATIGNWSSQREMNPLRVMNGAMAEMMIFSRVLNDVEIEKISQVTKYR